MTSLRELHSTSWLLQSDRDAWRPRPTPPAPPPSAPLLLLLGRRRGRVIPDESQARIAANHAHRTRCLRAGRGIGWQSSARSRRREWRRSTASGRRRARVGLATLRSRRRRRLGSPRDLQVMQQETVERESGGHLRPPPRRLLTRERRRRRWRGAVGASGVVAERWQRNAGRRAWQVGTALAVAEEAPQGRRRGDRNLEGVAEEMTQRALAQLLADDAQQHAADASITSGSAFSSKARRRCGKRSKRQNETDRATRRRGAASAASPPGKAPSERSPRKTPGPRTLASRR